MLARAFAALSVAVLLAAGCGDDSTNASPPDHPTGAKDVVASRRYAGGFTAPGADEASLPDLVVYGNGLAIAATQDGRALQVQLTADEVDGLVTQLLDTGLADLPARVEPNGPAVVADAPDTVLAFAVGDEVREVAANALDFAEYDYPQGLRDASVILQRLGDRVRAEGQPWTSDRIRVVASGLDGGDAATAWPTTVPVPAELTNASFEQPAIVAFTGEDAAALVEAFGTEQFQSLALPDGPTISITWRYLLPHE